MRGLCLVEVMGMPLGWCTCVEFDLINLFTKKWTRQYNYGITSPARKGVKIKSEGKPLSSACCATGEGITFLPLSLLEGGCVTIAATYKSY